MSKPTEARIAAALALAEAVETLPDGIENLYPHLAAKRDAYRATAPKLRTRAEVDAERLLNLDAWRANVLSGTELCMRDSILCAEPTQDSGPSGEHDLPPRVAATGAANSGNSPEPPESCDACSCEESEQLKAELDQARALSAEWQQVAARLQQSEAEMADKLQECRRLLGFAFERAKEIRQALEEIP